jgi:hypothetical protein
MIQRDRGRAAAESSPGAPDKHASIWWERPPLYLAESCRCDSRVSNREAHDPDRLTLLRLSLERVSELESIMRVLPLSVHRLGSCANGLLARGPRIPRAGGAAACCRGGGEDEKGAGRGHSVSHMGLYVRWKRSGPPTRPLAFHGARRKVCDWLGYKL